jgi:hypothetical protein
MACSNCANPFEIVTEETSVCNCGTLPGSVPAQTEGNSDGCCVISVNGKTGVVVLAIRDIDLQGNQFFTNALVYASLSGIAPISFNTLNGQISHANSGATPNTYGSATQIPVIAVDAKGHITSISTTSVSNALSANLQNLDAFTGTGYLVKTAPNTWAFRSLQGASGRIALTNPAGTAAGTTVDLQSGIVSAGTYGSSTQFPVITVDTYGRVTGITLQTVAAGAGDNWGTQTVQRDSTLAGNGTAGSPLKIAQQSATIGQCLKWNGTSWVPGDYTVMGGEFISGNGISVNPVEVNRITKIQDSLYGTGGYAVNTPRTIALTGWNATYTSTPSTDKAFLARFVFRIEVLEATTGGTYIDIKFQGEILLKLLIASSESGGIIVSEATVDQAITTTSKVFVRGESIVCDGALNITSILPECSLISPASFSNPSIEITVGTGITARIGGTYELDKKQTGKYVAQ